MEGAARHVDAVDVSPLMAARAAARCPDPTGVTWLGGDLLDPALPLPDAGYDVVTAVSSVHHLPLRPALTRLAELVRPGGVLVVVGHHRASTPADHLLSAVALVANAAVGAVLAVRGRAGEPDDEDMPVRPAQRHPARRYLRRRVSTTRRSGRRSKALSR